MGTVEVIFCDTDKEKGSRKMDEGSYRRLYRGYSMKRMILDGSVINFQLPVS
jgi:hypothetical protein